MRPEKTVEDIDAYIENIDENGNLEIGLSENNENICLSSDSDIEHLN